MTTAQWLDPKVLPQDRQEIWVCCNGLVRFAIATRSWHGDMYYQYAGCLVDRKWELVDAWVPAEKPSPPKMNLPEMLRVAGQIVAEGGSIQARHNGHEYRWHQPQPTEDARK